MAASADVIEMHAAIEQVLAELESIPSLKDEQKAALEAFKRKFPVTQTAKILYRHVVY